MTDKTSILKRIADLKNQGMSYQAIADRLRAEGLGDFSPSTIRRYLKEVQGEQSLITSPSTSQGTSTETPENAMFANKVLEDKNNEGLSNPEKFKERQGIVQLWTDDYKRDINWEDILLAILSLVFLAVMVIVGIVLTLKK
ncbi:MAG: helix-turn-helix domain-containing protein [Candidatus Parvarchaeota archaeon]